MAHSQADMRYGPDVVIDKGSSRWTAVAYQGKLTAWIP